MNCVLCTTSFRHSSSILRFSKVLQTCIYKANLNMDRFISLIGYLINNKSLYCHKLFDIIIKNYICYGVLMKNWFDNLSINKQRLISISLLIVGLIILVIAFDYLVLLILAIPLFLIGSSLLLYIEKKEKNKKNANSKKQKEAYYVSYEKQNAFSNTYKENFIEKYVIPDGKEICDFRVVETRVRGVYYNDIYDYEIQKNDKVAIKHNPNSEYPESTEVILISDKTLLGHLMKEMAMEFREKYGEKFCFIGKIIEFEKDEYDNEGKIGKIIIQFKVPKFKNTVKGN